MRPPFIWLIAVSLAGSATAADLPVSTLTVADSDWHVSLNGYRWRLPDVCLNPRTFGAADSGRKLGAADSGRNLGAADSGRNLGAADGGRNLGAADSGRNLGAADSGRNLGEGDAGRNLGAGDSGRNLGGAATAPQCTYISNSEITSAVHIWPASAGTLQLNPAVPELKSVRSWQQGALVELH